MGQMVAGLINRRQKWGLFFVSAILSNQHQKTASTKNESPFLVSVGTIDRHHKKT
jgi:hypothetical protein